MKPNSPRTVTQQDAFDYLHACYDLSAWFYSLAAQGVEALDVAILPWAARRDVGRLGADRADPLLQSFGDELGPVV